MEPSVPSLFTLLIQPDYVLVRMALVKEVGWEAAIVLQRVHWRCAVRPDGWRVSHEALAAELDLSVYTVRKATKELRDRGWLLSRRSDAWDPTPVWSLPDMMIIRDVENQHHATPLSIIT